MFSSLPGLELEEGVRGRLCRVSRDVPSQGRPHPGAEVSELNSLSLSEPRRSQQRPVHAHPGSPGTGGSLKATAPTHARLRTPAGRGTFVALHEWGPGVVQVPVLPPHPSASAYDGTSAPCTISASAARPLERPRPLARSVTAHRSVTAFLGHICAHGWKWTWSETRAEPRSLLPSCPAVLPAGTALPWTSPPTTPRVCVRTGGPCRVCTAGLTPGARMSRTNSASGRQGGG